MKLKKFFVTAIAALGLSATTLFSTTLVKADTAPAVPSNEEIIQKIEQKPVKSLQINQNIKISAGKKFKLKLANTIKGREKGPVINMVIKAGKAKTEMWANSKTLYTKEGKKWRKEKIKSSKKDSASVKSADLKKALSLIEEINNQVTNSLTVTEQGSNYILSLSNDPAFNQKFLKMVLELEKIPAKEKTTFMKNFKLDNYTFTETVQKSNYQLVNAKINIDMSYGKKFKLNVVETVDHINAYNNLQVPKSIVKHAKK